MGRKMSTKTLNSRSSAEDDSAEEVEGIEAEEEDSLAPKTKAKGSKPGKKAAVPSKSAKKAAERKEDEEDVEDEEVEEEVSPAPKTKAKGGKPSKKAAAPSKSVKKAAEAKADEDVEEEEEASSPAKKSKPSAKKSSAKNKTEEDDELDGDDEEDNEDVSPPKKAKIAKPKQTAGKSSKTESSGSLSNKEMILKAIEVLDDKTGSSVMSIKNYIIEHWPDKAESNQFGNNFKKAIIALAEENFIVRPKKQEDTPIGATGSYKINKEKTKEKEKEAKEKEKEKAAKDKEKGKAAKEKEKPVKEKEKAGKASTSGKSKESSKAEPSGPLTNKEMIIKALEDLDDKNGSSVVAIKNYITENWPEKAELAQFSSSFKKALTALAEESDIVRPKKQEGTPDGATGSYKINKEKVKEKEKEAKDKEKEKAAKEKEKATKEKEKAKATKEKPDTTKGSKGDDKPKGSAKTKEK